MIFVKYKRSLVEKLKRYNTYKNLDTVEFNVEHGRILECWQLFISQNSPGMKKNKDYFIHERNLFEVITRLDKRRVYYKVFHNLTSINEYKYVAILCYWINTLKPFMVVNERSPIYNAPNEMFSVYLIISMVRSVYSKEKPNEKFVYPSDRRITDMVYNFKYCGLSREATIAFVETFADNYGIGIQHIYNKLDNNNKKKHRSNIKC